MSDPIQLPVDSLPAQTDRLRRLAQSLVRDAAAADDVVQEAVAAAIARARGGGGPGTVGPGWLRSAVRSLAVDRMRSERSRARREREASRPGTAPDVSETVERAELARGLYDAILRLPEPMRDAVLLRHVDDLPPREMAERLGVSVPTAKKRLERGLAKLREDLEAEHGGRGRWAVALLPLTGADLGLKAAGGVILTGGLAAIALAAIGAAIAATSKSSGLGAEPDMVTGTLPNAAPAALSGIDLEEVAAGAERSSHVEEAAALPAQESPAPQDPPAATPSTPVEIKVVDLKGEPMAGAHFRWTGPQRVDGTRRLLGLSPSPPLPLTSDADGVIRTDRVSVTASAAIHLTATSPKLTTLAVGTDPEGNIVCVIAPAVHLAGLVLDPETKEPMPGARIEAAATVEAVTTFELDLNVLTFIEWKLDREGNPLASGRVAATDEHGRFEMLRVPSHSDFELEITRPIGTLVQRHPVPLADDLGLVLEAPKQWPAATGRAPRAFGRLSGADGSPVEGATVTLGDERVTTGPGGEYSLPLSRDATPIIASLRGKRFVVGPVPATADAMGENDAGPFDLVLPDKMGQLFGQVTDSNGRPLAGLDVVLVDATSPDGSSRILERPLRRSKSFSSLGAAVTDSRGVFGFTPTSERPYLVRVMDRNTGFAQAFPSVLANGPRPSRLVFDPATSSRTLRGVVRDIAGEAVQGARVRVQLAILDAGNHGTSMSVNGVSTTTGADGSFLLDGVPREQAKLLIDAGAKTQFGSPWSSPVEDLENDVVVTIDCPCELVVRSSRPESDFDQVAYENAEGDSLRGIAKLAGVLIAQRRTERRANGSFPLLVLPQSTSTLVLLRKGKAVERIPIGLRPDRRNRVDL